MEVSAVCGKHRTACRIQGRRLETIQNYICEQEENDKLGVTNLRTSNVKLCVILFFKGTDF